MWSEHFIEAKKCLAMYEKAMNNREWEVAELKAQEIENLAMAMMDAAYELKVLNGNPQG